MMDPAARGFPPGDLRVSDADRDLALSELREAFQVGRITAAEFDERAGRAVRARTGKELTALLADLPLEHPAAARSSGLARADHGLASRVTVVAAMAASACAALAAANVAHSGPSLQQREYLRESLARHGIYVPLPPAQGFDWAGTITPVVVALLLVAVIIVLRVSRARHG
jgi:hypothetical protein